MGRLIKADCDLVSRAPYRAAPFPAGLSPGVPPRIVLFCILCLPLGLGCIFVWTGGIASRVTSPEPTGGPQGRDRRSEMLAASEPHSFSRKGKKGRLSVPSDLKSLLLYV